MDELKHYLLHEYWRFPEALPLCAGLFARGRTDLLNPEPSTLKTVRGSLG